MAETSTKPYLIRAIYEWCTDNGLRPHIAVAVDERTVVPREFVRNGEIVLNVSPEATSGLRIGNELIEFEARFNRVSREVSIPVENVSAVYAAENGHGMAFDVPKALGIADSAGAQQRDDQAAVAPRGPALLEAVPSRAARPDPADEDADGPSEPTTPAPGAGRGKPHLTRIK